MSIVSAILIAQLAVVIATAAVCRAAPVRAARFLSRAAMVVAGLCAIGFVGMLAVVATRADQIDDPIRSAGVVYFWIAYVTTLPWWEPAASELHGELTDRFGETGPVIGIGLLPLLIHVTLAIGLHRLARWQADHAAHRAPTEGTDLRRPPSDAATGATSATSSRSVGSAGSSGPTRVPES